MVSNLNVVTSRLVLVFITLIITALISSWLILAYQLLINIEAIQVIKAKLSNNTLNMIIVNKGVGPTTIIYIVVENVSGSWAALGNECINITVNPNQPIMLNCTLPTQTIHGNIYTIKIQTIRYVYIYHTKAASSST